jgi:hypothetical protein
MGLVMTHPVHLPVESPLRAAAQVLRRCIGDEPFDPAGRFTELSPEISFHSRACCECPHGCRLALGSAFQCAALQQEEKKGGMDIVRQVVLGALRDELAH